MLQSKARLLQLNAKLAETLTSKGVSATADETTTALVNKVADITSGDLIYFSKGGRLYIKDILFPDSVTNIDLYSFQNCSNLETITIPESVIYIGQYAFDNCTNLKSVTIFNGIQEIKQGAFVRCSSLETITIPESVTNIGVGIFNSCYKIINVTLGNGFNGNNLDLSASTKIERDTIVNCFNAFADRTGLTAYTFTIKKVVGNKLTDEDRAIAVAKNWTLVEK